MTNPDELRRLAERVEAGSGFDIDSDVCEAFPDVYGYCVVELTTSIDDVEALREMTLPKTELLVVQHTSRKCFDAILQDLTPIEGDDEVLPAYKGTAPTEARARLAALLRAVAGKEG